MNHYAVEVVRLDPERVALELRTRHVDAGPPGETATFALNLVLDQWARLVRRHDVRLDFDENRVNPARRAWGPALDAQLERLHALAFGAEIEVDEETGKQARRDGVYEGVRVRGGWSRARGGVRKYVLLLQDDWEAFEREAPRVVKSVRATAHVNQDAYRHFPEPADTPAGQQAYDAACPRVTLEIELDPPGLAGFLKPGMAWETAVYR